MPLTQHHNFILLLCLSVFIFFVLIPPLCSAHGIFTDPRQRGALRLDNHPVSTIDHSAPQDYRAHFPSGDKSEAPGAGLASIRRAASNQWTPYTPHEPSFIFRAGVCGDELGRPQEHLRGGEFYYDAKRVRTYTEGAVVHFEVEVVTHHNGFFEFQICNIDACGDDISPECFRKGYCQLLKRAASGCDSQLNPYCAPIDPAYPGRWYLPCKRQEPQVMGGAEGTMPYMLPMGLACDHCVIQWYWCAANTCNPPGVREFFEGEHAPRWGQCEGQGGALAGFADKGECGGDQFAEEYWQCSDVRIVPRETVEEDVGTGGASAALGLAHSQVGRKGWKRRWRKMLGL